MLTLYQPPRPDWGIPNISPFCVKLETYLRMAGIEHQVKTGDPRKAPKGKIPYVEDQGAFMGDSGLIIDYLKATRGDPLDGALSDEEKAVSLAVSRMVEEHAYFAYAWLRWNTDESWRYVRRFFMQFMPPVVGGAVLQLIKKNFNKSIYGQGMGRHCREEILHFARQDTKAVSDFLGDKNFAMGKAPTSLDATLYGFLVNWIEVPWDSEAKRYALQFRNLKPYCDRMKARFWS